MKTMTSILRMTMGTGLLLGALALTARAEGTDERAADHAQLVALREKFIAAMSAKDMTALSSCFTTNFVFTPIDQTTLTSREAIVAHYEKLFKGPDAPLRDVRSTAEADERTRFIDEDTGIVYGKGKDTFVLRDGTESTFDYRWTATVHKENGEWKAVAVHFGTNFMDNPYLTRMVGVWKKGAAGTLVVGLLLGFFVGRCRSGSAPKTL